MSPDCKPDAPEFIKNSDRLLRRIHKRDIEDGRITEAAFDDDYCSVNMENKTEESLQEFLGCAHPKNINYDTRKEHGETLLDKGWKVAVVTPEQPRKHSQSVYPDPIDINFKDGNYPNKVHALICGTKSDALLFEMAEEANRNTVLG